MAKKALSRISTNNSTICMAKVPPEKSDAAGAACNSNNELPSGSGGM